MTDLIRAPWTAEQVAALNEFQRRGGMHPFTCGHEHPAHPNAILEATPKGWRCFVLDCEYEQDWAHAFMAGPEAWPRFPFGERHGPTPEEMKAATEATGPGACGYCPHCGRGDAAPTADEYEQQRQRAERATKLNEDRAALINALITERDRLRARLAAQEEQTMQEHERAQQLAATLNDVLRHFVHKGHPGEPCLSSGWISETTVARWRAVAYPPQPAAHDAGPTIAECAHNDRRWPLEKEGE